MYSRCHRFLLTMISILGSRKQKEFIRSRLLQNYDGLSKNIHIWIHASSVGEVNLLEQFLQTCLENFEGDILLTIFTDTGRETALQKYGKEERVHILYFPLDDKTSIQKILDKISLQNLYLIETELWPNLITFCHQRARVVVVNGRISGKSFRRYQKIKFLLKAVLQKIESFYVQTEEDKKRYISLGAKKEDCYTVGNLKFDISMPSYSEEEREEYRREFCLQAHRVWVAGSTRTGEYDILLDAFQKLKNYRLVLVPRHLERVPEVEILLQERKISYQKYSDFKREQEFSVLLVDRMGVLRKLYSIADVTFVGATLVDIGGHSLLEPLSYEKTPIFGPYTQNVKEIAKTVLERGIGYQVRNSEEIVEAIDKIEKQSQSIREEVRNFLQENKEVGKKILEREAQWNIKKKK
ncbi:3-deoxy-D-manno-octulosonic acid transferase [Fusobacterium necrophorum]|uniref:3-deoxy-D-manno-octulosonic acid transferase n=1 Tax=Fusobacterium necrophorum TaxID=859 RepID=UPI0004A90338|nr:glycosyltransferase N-terminal domain-containing protein [Fusobacterium necrophorum]KDE65091.1 3-deoxy-D-manno-octulosonic acid transferase [Fusobacterium necrophorum DJ-1]MCF0162775.1 3-deoxy-D-manno-octulosonic acid transferase [Fusobacterium necrophorum]